MTVSRCVTCGDVSPDRWLFCRRCHAYNDLHVALRFVGTAGIDEFRLKRALAYLRPRRPRFATSATVAKLLRRVEALEALL
jgi:hypothetical protein